MISKKDIKDLDFKTIEDIYNYIVESEINGNIAQYKELVNNLSKVQFKDFLHYLGMQDINKEIYIHARIQGGNL